MVSILKSLYPTPLVEAQIVRVISANEWGVTTEFWHFDFSAYLKHGTYGIMGSYGTFMHYVRGKKEKKIPIGVMRPKIRVKNEISRFLKFLSSSTSRLALLDLTPDSSSCPGQLLRA